MVLLLVQAILTSATVVHCASYKSQLRMGAPECEDSMLSTTHYYEVKLVKAGAVDTNEQICQSQTFSLRHLQMCKILYLIIFQVFLPAVAHVNCI